MKVGEAARGCGEGPPQPTSAGQGGRLSWSVRESSPKLQESSRLGILSGHSETPDLLMAHSTY